MRIQRVILEIIKRIHKRFFSGYLVTHEGFEVSTCEFAIFLIRLFWSFYIHTKLACDEIPELRNGKANKWNETLTLIEIH